jgi:acetyl esterase/lipase
MKISKFYLAILLVTFLIQQKAQSQFIPCNVSTDSCQDLLHPIPGVIIDRDSINGNIQKYFYGKTANSPVDYNSFDSTCSNAGNELFFTVTYPGNYNYATCPALPCIVLFHPGGYSDSSTFEPFRKYADEFAKRGYVAFNVEYRRGWDSEPSQNKYIGTGQMVAAYRADQDIRGALKSIVKMKTLGNVFTNFNFDLNKFYIGGASAGAFMSINIAYINQAEMDAVAPGVANALGNINSPLAGSYYGSGTPLPSIKGVLSMWGAGPGLLNGASPSYINGNNLPPFIAFHGELDIVAPFDRRTEFYCDDTKNSQYAAITQCSGAQTVQYDIRAYDNDAGADYTNYGSNAIYQRLHDLNIPTEVYLDSDMKHGLSAASDFGIGTNNQDSVISYMAGRTATFFQALARGYYTFTKTKFRDCENTRKGCEAEPTNSCGSSKPAKSITAIVPVNNELSAGLKVSPNPASSQFKIEMNSREIISGINVYNQQGKLLLQKKVSAYSVIIHRSEIGNAPGVYIVEVANAGKTIKKKVLVF